MTVTLRTGASPEDVRAAIAPIWHYFGFAPPAEAVANFTALMTPARTLIASADGHTVGGCGSFGFQLTTPGGFVPCCGLSMVGVMPTHRRRGVLSAMVARTFDDCRARGEPVAYLWASDERIYGRFGFGLTGLSADIRVAREHSAPLEGRRPSQPSEGTLRRVALADAFPPLAEVYRQVSCGAPGAFARSAEWWRRKVLADPDWRRRGSGEMQCVVLDGADWPTGYALYRMNMSVERGTPAGTAEVIEALGTTPAATAMIWRFLLDMDWTSAITASFLPLDHPLILSVLEPRRLNLRLRDGAWLRIVDLPAAMAARSFGVGEIVVDVTDDACPDNAGCWRIGSDGVRRTTGGVDLRCDIAALASVYLGGFSWRQLVASNRAFATNDDAVLRADRVFERHSAPWCPEIF